MRYPDAKRRTLAQTEPGMSVTHSKDAIGAVTQLLQTTLHQATGIAVDIGHPAQAAKASGQRFNLFLYQIGYDHHLHGEPLEDGGTPIWAILHYMLNAFEDQDCDSIKAQQLLGLGMSTLHCINFVDASKHDVALVNNPEPLKLSFGETGIDALAKLSQGEPFRLCATFQVGPVMIAPTRRKIPDITQHVPVEDLPAMQNIGPQISHIHPPQIECGHTLTVYGSEIDNAEWVLFGAQQLPVTHSEAGQIRAEMPLAPVIAPGSYPVSVARIMQSGKLRVSNALLGTLIPSVERIEVNPAESRFTVHGLALGGPSDDVYIALCQHGATLYQLDVVGSQEQTHLNVQLPHHLKLPEGSYQIIVRVNGAQAEQAPMMDWV